MKVGSLPSATWKQFNMPHFCKKNDEGNRCVTQLYLTTKPLKSHFLPSPRLPRAHCQRCLSSQAQLALELPSPSWCPNLLHPTSSNAKQFVYTFIWGQLGQSPNQKSVTSTPVLLNISTYFIRDFNLTFSSFLCFGTYWAVRFLKISSVMGKAGGFFTKASNHGQSLFF